MKDDNDPINKNGCDDQNDMTNSIDELDISLISIRNSYERPQTNCQKRSYFLSKHFVSTPKSKTYLN